MPLHICNLLIICKHTVELQGSQGSSVMSSCAMLKWQLTCIPRWLWHWTGVNPAEYWETKQNSNGAHGGKSWWDFSVNGHRVYSLHSTRFRVDFSYYRCYTRVTESKSDLDYRRLSWSIFIVVNIWLTRTLILTKLTDGLSVKIYEMRMESQL